jgi:hypothetical protein
MTRQSNCCIEGIIKLSRESHAFHPSTDEDPMLSQWSACFMQNYASIDVSGTEDGKGKENTKCVCERRPSESTCNILILK